MCQVFNSIDKSLVKKRNTKIYTFSIAWGNPYTKPPDNLPRYIISYQSFQHRLDVQTTRKFDAILKRFENKGIFGYYQCFDCETINTVKWSIEAKHRNRLRRLKIRIRKKYGFPMFWINAMQEEIAKKPEYFGVCYLDNQ